MIAVTQGYSLERRADAGMFADRKRLFVDLMDWDVAVTADRYEIDEYDSGDATYLVATNTAGDHEGSMRLLPTRGRHILADLFASLAPRGVPRGEHILEITRLCLPCRLGAAYRLVVRNRLISAMVDHALATGIEAFTGVVRPGFRNAVLAMGWDGSPLGDVVIIGGMPLAAFRIEIDQETPRRLAETGIYLPGARAAQPAMVAA